MINDNSQYCIYHVMQFIVPEFLGSIAQQNIHDHFGR